MRYTTFGLVLDSEIELPELPPVSNKLPVDVTIRYGHVPQSLGTVTTRGVLYELNDTQFLLEVDRVARYFVMDGRTITVERMPCGDTGSVRMFLLGSSMGAILHQRNILPLHGSTIATPHGAVTFTGASGAGKSTTAAAMLRRGTMLLSDDVSAIRLDNRGVPIVYPGYPQQKLWTDSLKALDADSSTLHTVRPNIDKFAVPVEQFHHDALPLRAIYMLHSSNQAQHVSIEPIEGWFKMAAIKDQVYRREFMLQDGATLVHAQQFVALAQHVHVRGVTRPAAPFLLDELVNVLEKDIEQWAAQSG